MNIGLDSVMESQAAQLNLLLYQIYRPYFNGKEYFLSLIAISTDIESISKGFEIFKIWISKYKYDIYMDKRNKKWFKGDNDFNKEDIDLLQSDKKLSNICP